MPASPGRLVPLCHAFIFVRDLTDVDLMERFPRVMISAAGPNALDASRRW